MTIASLNKASSHSCFPTALLTTRPVFTVQTWWKPLYLWLRCLLQVMCSTAGLRRALRTSCSRVVFASQAMAVFSPCSSPSVVVMAFTTAIQMSTPSTKILFVSIVNAHWQPPPPLHSIGRHQNSHQLPGPARSSPKYGPSDSAPWVKVSWMYSPTTSTGCHQYSNTNHFVLLTPKNKPIFANNWHNALLNVSLDVALNFSWTLVLCGHWRMTTNKLIKPWTT